VARRVQTPKKAPLLPEKARAFFARMGLRTAGIGLSLAFAALAVALATYNQQDPGLISGSNSSPENWLGYPGAYAADILMQTLGLASFILILPLLTWAWRVGALKRVDKFWGRLAALPFMVTLWATCFAALPQGSEWYFSSVGYGGLLGEALTGLLQAIYSHIPSFGIPGYAYIAIFWGLVGLAPLFFTLGLERGEWIALGRGIWGGFLYFFRIFAALGARVHGLLFKTREIGDTKRVRRDKREPVMSGLSSARKEVKDPARPRLGERSLAERQQAMEFGGNKKFKLPTLDLLTEAPEENTREKVDKTALEQNARMLESVLDDFGIQGEIVKVWPGPVVTLYELEPAPGTKSSRIISLADDIARSMSAISARIAIVPGRNVIGIELPNVDRKTVYLRELLSSTDFENSRASLAIALGKDISGNAVIADLSAMPHLLVAGTTGSGKSVGLNVMILSLLYKLSPEQCKFIMVDPKMLELSVYDGIPHLLTPVVTEPRKAIVALKWAVKEMEERYRAMSKLGVRSLAAYNRSVGEAIKKGKIIKRQVQTGFDPESGEPQYEMQEFDLSPFPQIVIVIDEMADLMLVAGKDVEATVQRLAQMARAAGIHLIMATQRPSVDVITGTIKANFPTRIAFQVTSKIDSRTILGEQGAEQMLGRGDMLFMSGSGRIKRVHGPFVSDQEVERVVAQLKRQGQPDYIYDVTEEPEGGFDSPFIPGGNDGAEDELYQKAVEILRRDRKASTSYLQRRLSIGYNRAATLIERLEDDGLVSAPNHKGQREVLLPEV